MGVRFPSVASTVIQNATLVTTAATVVATTPPINLPYDNAQVLLYAYANITMGTGTTSLTYVLRRGPTVSDTLITTASAITVVAGNKVLVCLCYPDQPGVVAGQQYSLAVQQTAASANGTVNDVAIIAMIL